MQLVLSELCDIYLPQDPENAAVFCGFSFNFSRENMEQKIPNTRKVKKKKEIKDKERRSRMARWNGPGEIHLTYLSLSLPVSILSALKILSSAAPQSVSLGGCSVVHVNT